MAVRLNEDKEVVAMIEQKYMLGGMARNQAQCIEAYQIPVIYRATVEEIQGSGRISSVVVRHLDSGEREYIECDTLITAVGLIPERELLTGIGTPEWLRCCGNCDSIHEIVDAVSSETIKIMEKF